MNKNRRKSDMQTLATRAGAIYTEGDQLGLMPLLREMRLFRKGFRKKIINVVTIEETWGKCHIIDYTHKRSRGNTIVKKSRTVAFVNSKLLGIPWFEMKPRSIFDMIIGLIHKQGILFPEDTAFFNRYIVNSENESLIKHYFKGEVLEAFKGRKDWHAEGLGYYLILYRKEGLIPAGQLSRFIEDSMHLSLQLMKNRYDANWLLK